eukprot:TRINITY_DN55414_c0_g1_i1.p1 TRINITY_DN55414_c0_g1~~TRINITY_DN55414_c0_g1_i1.p1  ORF type:complete len:368 (-),score=25.39 TRINITY_DN55414_c0_g1_i1:92-1195(-)
MNAIHAAFMWASTLAICISFCFSSCLCWRCVMYLYRRRRRVNSTRHLVRHIAAIAGADTLVAAWAYLGSLNATGRLLVTDDPSWCALFTTVRMWLILLSALWTASLALVALAGLVKWQQDLRMLSYCTIGVLPLSIILSVFQLGTDVHFETSYDGSWTCEQSPAAIMVECVEQTTILIFIVCIVCTSMWRLRQLGEAATMEGRSLRIVVRYLVAYIASYSLWIVARWPWASQYFGDWTPWKIFVAVSWRLLLLNGAFNFVALWLHARDSVRGFRQHCSNRVQLLDDEAMVTTVEVKRINVKHLNRSITAQVADVQNANQRLWRELNLTYEQGVTGEMEPLPPEERADHFSSIFGLTYSPRLQEARVI